jgi:uncharacterized protein (DUF1778 family)
MMQRSVVDALCALADAVDSQRAAELGQVLAIASVCELYRVNEESVMAGAERLLRFGGAGTPLVGEFILGEIGPILGVSLESARQRVAEVLNLRFRHPRLWAAVCAGKVRPWQAFKVTTATNTAHLDADAADWVDSQVAVALAFQPIGRVLGQVATWVVRADPALAAEREAEKSASRYVRFSELTDRHTDLELAWLMASPASRPGRTLPEVIPQRYHSPMAMTLRLTPDDEQALALLAEADGVSKQEATVRAIHEAASRRVRRDEVKALSGRARERYADLLGRLSH